MPVYLCVYYTFVYSCSRCFNLFLSPSDGTAPCRVNIGVIQFSHQPHLTGRSWANVSSDGTAPCRVNIGVIQFIHQSPTGRSRANLSQRRVFWMDLADDVFWATGTQTVPYHSEHYLTFGPQVHSFIPLCALPNVWATGTQFHATLGIT